LTKAKRKEKRLHADPYGEKLTDIMEDTQNEEMRRKMPRKRLFIPSEKDDSTIVASMMTYANRGYLAALLDRHHVGVSFLKKGVPLHVRISMGESHEEARRTFEFIREHFGVNAIKRLTHLSKSKGFDRRKEYGFASAWKPTWYLMVTDPEDVLSLCRAALPYSERKERLKKVINACEHLLGRRA
jgi:hypothetical protein